jgi:hypothetical protein
MARTWTRTVVVTLGAIVLVWGVGPRVQAETGNPGGQQFKFFGSAEDAYDPDQPTNQCIVFETAAGGSTVAGVERTLKPGTKIANLDNQVQLKYYFEGTKQCIGGSPRIQLGVDCNGDGIRDWNAFGYVGDQPFGGLCDMNQWVFEDMTNNVAKWDLAQGGGGMTNTWDQMETFINMACPNHRIVNGVLVEDACSFQPLNCGVTFYDNVVIGDQTLDDHKDTN